jgi:peptidyl-prolyl cis-trans isomerase B (cyclophilin B)
MTVTTDQGGPITAELDLANSPCAAASIAHLASRAFYDNTKCHEITTEGALRCGDPTGTGLGGPTYTFPTENAPAPEPARRRARRRPDRRRTRRARSR